MAERTTSAPRPRLTRERIVERAVGLVDRVGPDLLSMRSLAAELGVGTMSLYNHVSGKEDVLDAVAEAIVSEMDLTGTRTGDWATRTRELARAFRALALAHPRAFPLVLTRRYDSPESLRPMEQSLQVLHEAGFDGDIAVSLFRTFVAFESGSLLRELGSTSLACRPHDGAHRRAETLDREEFPRVVELAPLLVACDHEAEYEFGIELLLRSVAHLRTER